MLKVAVIGVGSIGQNHARVYLEADPDGVHVTRDVMADTFSQPARLSPVMARGLLLALGLLGDTFALEGLESLASVREKVRNLVGADHTEIPVIIDEVVPVPLSQPR